MRGQRLQWQAGRGGEGESLQPMRTAGLLISIESTTSRRKLTELIKGWFPYDRRRSQKVLRSSAVILETQFCDIVCDPSWSQTIAEDRTMFCLLRSPAIAYVHMETKVLQPAIETYPIIFLILIDDSTLLSHKPACSFIATLICFKHGWYWTW